MLCVDVSLSFVEVAEDIGWRSLETPGDGWYDRLGVGGEQELAIDDEPDEDEDTYITEPVIQCTHKHNY